MKLAEAAGLLSAFVARLITGAQGHWLGSPPRAEQRICFANHQRHFDWVLIWAALPGDLRAITRPIAARDYLTSTPLKHWSTREVFNAVYASRPSPKGEPALGSADEDPLEPLMGALRNGDSLVILPEGTRGSRGEPAPFKAGLHQLARAFPEVQLLPTWIDHVQRVMPQGEVVPAPILCSATFGAPLTRWPDEDRRALLDRARGCRLAKARPLMDTLRELTVSQQVGLLFVLLFVLLFGGLAIVTALAFGQSLRPEPARAQRRTARSPCAVQARPARGVGRGAAVLGRVGPGCVRFDPAVRRDLVPRAARIRHADAHAARRPPQPVARLLHRAAVAVRGRRDAPLRPVYRLHPALCIPRDSGRQRLRQRPDALSGAHREDPVGHHGVRLRHEPRTRAVAAEPARIPGARRLPGAVPGGRGGRRADRADRARGGEPAPAARWASS